MSDGADPKRESDPGTPGDVNRPDARVDGQPSRSLRPPAPTVSGNSPAREFRRLAPDAAAFRLEFWSRVRKGDGCWEWLGSRCGGGYGGFFIHGRSYKAHRISLLLTTGEWPIEVLHRCDNPPCVRPDHLLGGTHTDNMRDAVAKGRISYPRKRKDAR